MTSAVGEDACLCSAERAVPQHLCVLAQRGQHAAPAPWPAAGCVHARRRWSAHACMPPGLRSLRRKRRPSAACCLGCFGVAFWKVLPASLCSLQS